MKYVEDDIVLSINVKTLEFRSVNGNWTPSFIDLSTEDLILRNLATLTDLTVCLDKRNSSGKIENYQEPLLYRCSLACRIVRKFESINSMLHEENYASASLNFMTHNKLELFMS